MVYNPDINKRFNIENQQVHITLTLILLGKEENGITSIKS